MKEYASKKIPFAPSTERIWNNALHRAGEVGDSMLQREHILWSIANDERIDEGENGHSYELPAFRSFDVQEIFTQAEQEAREDMSLELRPGHIMRVFLREKGMDGV